MSGLIEFPCPVCNTTRTVSVLDCNIVPQDAPTHVTTVCPACGTSWRFRLSARVWWRLVRERSAVMDDWHDDIAQASVGDFEGAR